MLTELGGKGGDVCSHAREGTIRCPLIVRPTSEDVVTGELFGALEAIDPRWWLPDLLNEALGARRFRRQVYRRLRIRLWKRQPAFPGHLVPWREGQTEVDAVITWENPATTVYVEMKLHSAVGASVSNHAGENGYRSDQLLRNARVGLWRCGWYDEELLFRSRRDFALVLMTLKGGDPLVKEYRDPARLRAELPHGELLTELPRGPFVGGLGYEQVARLLERNARLMARPERVLATRTAEYLRYKSAPRRS
jgi:hypothetical protein